MARGGMGARYTLGVAIVALSLGGCAGALTMAPLGALMVEDAVDGGETAPGPPSARLDGDEIEDNLAGNTVLVEWYDQRRITRIECGYFSARGAYDAANFVADDDTYDAASALRRRGRWSVRGDALCVDARDWGCFEVEIDAERLRLIADHAVRANILIYRGAAEFEHARCGL